jgi:hypothetical protein
VSAHAGPGLERHEPVGLRCRGVRDLPHVDPHAVAEDRQLVHEGDVHRAEDVLEQLGQLRRLRRQHLHDLVADLAVEVDRTPPALVREAAHHLRRRAHRVVGSPRVDALGGEGREEVAPRGEPGRLEQRDELVTCGPRICRGLEHHQLALLERARERGAGRDQRLKVRLPVAGKRRGDGHDDRVDLGELRVARAWVETARDRGQRLVRHVLHMRAARRERVRDARVGVHAHHLVPGLAECDGKREADVAEANYPDLHRR